VLGCQSSLLRPDPIWKRLHIFDFFAGRGRDCDGNPGSPTRLLTEIQTRWKEISGKQLTVTLTACDSSPAKIQSLTEYFNQEARLPVGLKFDPCAGEFATTFERYFPVLQNKEVACLVLLDQYGFKQVDSEVFQKLTKCPTTDILFFVSTQHLHRFSEHPDVRKYIELERAEDYHLAHQEVMKWYRSQIPVGVEYYLAPFSFRKGSNIYSVIFGSSHPRGMEQFLSVAWQKDKLNGEADYDLNREDFQELAPYLAFDMFVKPRKTQVFEASLEEAIRHAKVTNERQIYLFCLENGMMPSHASPVLAKLKKENVIECAFKSPNRDSLKNPRAFRLLGP
jgi:three-Cys-motif partner protein